MELLGIRIGLEHALQYNFSNLITQNDSIYAFGCINMTKHISWVLPRTLIHDVLALTQQIGVGKVFFVYSESNSITDLFVEEMKYFMDSQRSFRCSRPTNCCIN